MGSFWPGTHSWPCQCQQSTKLGDAPIQAHSRLAALLADLKHNNRAVDVLERLEGLMKGSPWEAADVARRLCDARLGAKSNAVDHYKLLGLDRGVTSEDVSIACCPCILTCCRTSLLDNRARINVHTFRQASQMKML